MSDLSALLICREDIDNYLKEALESGESAADKLEKTLPHAVDGAIRKTIEDRIRDVSERRKAIQKGFIPISLSYFARPDTTSKSQQEDMENAVNNMPSEVKEVWEKAKTAADFSSFTIVDAGDCGRFLIGKAGDKHFYIAGWV
jgi:creatinine amidohydrolase/Fe(II)-dependent formamide hydrolase-like protein